MALEDAKKLIDHYRVPVVVEIVLERVTNMAMGGQGIDGIVEFEPLHRDDRAYQHHPAGHPGRGPGSGPLRPLVHRPGEGDPGAEFGEHEGDCELSGQDDQPSPEQQRAAEAEPEQLEHAGENRDVAESGGEGGKASQRAVQVLTALGDAGRTVLIAPARTGRPESRRLVAFSHPDGRITEIATYTDDIAPTPPAANDRQLTGTRAVLSAAPHKALTHQRVLVTASTDALGLDVATAFGRAGASVVFHGRRPEFVPPAGGEGAVVTYVCADLDQPNGAVALAEQAASALGGPVTTLVNNLGPWDGTPVSEVSPAAWSAALQSGVTAHLRLSQLVAPGMREAGRGRIYNITTASTSKRSHGTYGFVKARPCRIPVCSIT